MLPDQAQEQIQQAEQEEDRDRERAGEPECRAQAWAGRGGGDAANGGGRMFHDAINHRLGSYRVNGGMRADWTETACLELPAGAVVPMQQHPAYGEACAALGAGQRRFSLRAPGGQVMASAQVLERRVPLLGGVALLSRGPVWAPDIAAARRRDELSRLLERLRAGRRFVAVTSDLCAGGDPMEGQGWLRVMSPGHLAVLELVGGAEAMRARQHGKWRNRLRRAGEAGLEVRHGAMPADPSHWLLERDAEQARRRRYRGYPPAFTAAWVAQGGRRSAQIFTACVAGRPVAAMLFLLHGRAASYHVGWSGAEGRARGAHTLLLWRAQLWLAGRGIRALELGLLDTGGAPGLARFKLGSGAQAVRLGASYLYAPGTGLFAGRRRALADLLPGEAFSRPV